MSSDYSQPNQPDILEVIANLSNDAVFTPPKVVNAVLDLLPAEVWTDPALRWLDPCAKTGVFPREVTKRLMVGLANEIPDEDARLKHILAKMVFAIATEELTGMMTRRSLYCSKDASGEFAVIAFANPDGNVWQGRVEHSFNERGTCTECRGTRAELELDGRDNKAYGFIHATGRATIEKEMSMKFDVIVGNPPYQMSGGGGGTNDTPLYNVFVEEALKLNPRYVSMIVPSRWMAGGRGLDDFRAQMLGDKRVRVLVDYPNAGDLFPGVEIQSGVCYFLWSADTPGPCSVTLVRGEERIGPTERQLDEFDVFVRDGRALAVLRKVRVKKETSVTQIVSGDTPFGLPTNFKGYRKGDKKVGDLKLHLIEKMNRKERWVPIDQITKNVALIRPWKVLVPMSYNGGPHLPHRIIGQSFVAGPNNICTQSYLVIGPFGTKEAADSFQSYITTRFFRFLLSLRKISQHAMRSTYEWVPQQTWDRIWTDAELYKKYRITSEEQAYIEAMVKEIPA
jgi:site-specific DNA-methyltransferase (adenine-specific)